MANPEHVAKLSAGVNDWNKWRKENPVLGEDLRQGGVKELEQHKIDLRYARLEKRDLRGFDLSFADLHRATLWHSDLSGANLEGADLSSVNLNFANLSGANLRGAILRFSRLAEADVSESLLSGSFVYASSIWNVKGQPKEQVGIVITPKSEPEITVDDIEIAQFIYLLLSNAKIRHVIDTITSKVVLILGRFTPERKTILDAIREELRKRDYVPVLFDFEKPASKDLTGTISTLANLTRFIIADLTDPSSVPHELATLAPATVVPVQAILLEGQREYAMFPDLVRRYHWVLEPYQYKSLDSLLAQLNDRVIAPAETKAIELQRKRVGSEP
jgi:hypothetical protein